ncbi:hypothetical protein N7510_003553 [Penicillium lagena]|uniref:uncharacterized protein n=1 Tax=Penicillium lagena TaxID=94218 RepID=UPI002540DEEE|nr:uncharacterized protein N7510_003553 [Penicillium lagena]KAJ5619569.1 hypothetical protein N7510_003553 [Penicillium lagena]
MSQAEVTRTESIDEQERARDAEDKKPKSRRPAILPPDHPAPTALELRADHSDRPILTPKSVLPLFFIVGVLFAPIGGVLIWASSQVQEISLDYSDCTKLAPEVNSSDFGIIDFPDKVLTEAVLDQNLRLAEFVYLPPFFKIPNELPAPVYMYYRLTNFYQNHRRYVQSLELDQLKGTAVPNSTISGGTCSPLDIDPVTKKAYYPCGLIANSQFNDTIGNPKNLNLNSTYDMSKNGIAWASDKDLVKKTQYQPDQVVPPPNWELRYPQGYTASNMPDLHNDEDFLVWMRTAGLPAFSKLSRRNDDAAMPEGLYRLDIVDNFPVTEYDGTKSILISTRTVMGGKNPSMGIAYVVIGGFCVLLGVLFTIAHLVRPRKLGDHTYLTWESNQPSTAVATGRDDRFGPNAI